jgi:GNAT superfamily N-acetyltransferase
MGQPHHTADRTGALQFIAEQQRHPATACAYLGTDAASVEADLLDLDQPWAQTLRVTTGAQGEITGAAVIEWDEEVGRSWVHGPWLSDEVTCEEAHALLGSVIAQSPVTAHEMYASTRNQRIARLAEAAGWKAGPAHFEYVLAGPVEAPAQDPSLVLRLPHDEDEPHIAKLHEAEFPHAYATARQLLDPGQPYAVLVAQMGGRAAGYIAAQSEGDALYIDFLAVDPEARRQGVGASLLAGMVGLLGGDRMRLTVSEEQAAARAMYTALGFREGASSRAFHSA